MPCVSSCRATSFSWRERVRTAYQRVGSGAKLSTVCSTGKLFSATRASPFMAPPSQSHSGLRQQSHGMRTFRWFETGQARTHRLRCVIKGGSKVTVKSPETNGAHRTSSRVNLSTIAGSCNGKKVPVTKVCTRSNGLFSIEKKDSNGPSGPQGRFHPTCCIPYIYDQLYRRNKSLLAQATPWKMRHRIRVRESLTRRQREPDPDPGLHLDWPSVHCVRLIPPLPHSPDRSISQRRVPVDHRDVMHRSLNPDLHIQGHQALNLLHYRFRRILRFHPMDQPRSGSFSLPRHPVPGRTHPSRNPSASRDARRFSHRQPVNHFAVLRDHQPATRRLN